MNLSFLIIAFLQGVILTFFYYVLEENKFLDNFPVVISSVVITLSVLLPSSYFLTEGLAFLSRTKRFTILAIIAVLSFFLSMYHGYTQYYSHQLIWFNLLLPASILYFCLLCLLTSREQVRVDASYRPYFTIAWKNMISLLLAGAILALLWIILWTMAELFKQIGIHFFHHLFDEPYFVFPVSCVTLSIAFAYSASQQQAIVNLRTFKLTAQKWLYPLLIVFTLGWALMFLILINSSLMQQQEMTVLDSKGFLLLWVVALAVHLLNCAFQAGDAQKPYPKILGAFLRFAWVSIPVIAFMGLYCVLVRVQQYGWTNERIWALVIAVLACTYAVGYGFSIIKKQSIWMWSVAKTNVYAAYLLCGLLLLLLSPLLNPIKVSVDNQLARLYDGRIDAKDFDYYYLRERSSGFYGEEKLSMLAEGIDHPQADLIKVLAYKALHNRYDDKDDVASPDKQQKESFFNAFTEDLLVYPDKNTIDAYDEKITALFNLLVTEDDYTLGECLESNGRCLVWFKNVDADDELELLFVYENISHTWQSSISVFDWHNDAMSNVGHFNIPAIYQCVDENKHDNCDASSVIDLIMDNKIITEKPKIWFDLKYQEKTYQLIKE